MKRALRIFSVAAAVMAVVCVTPLRGVGSGQTPQEKYIEKWAPTAVREMYRSGVPASITLSQGLLESRYGLSSLALEGNNHFGIKCHNNWTGGRMYYDDDAKGECFRKYVSADESFSDHSDFLRYRDRYKFLFEYETTDYKSWAYGLKKAGYATDPSYATKLIKYIEDYKLYVYDTMTVGDVDSESEWNDLQDGDSLRQGGKLTRKQKKVLKKAQKAAAKGKNSGSGNAAGGSDTSPGNDATRDVIPKSPLKLEEPTKVDKSQYEEFHFSLSRQMYERNGVPYVLSVEGETYSSIASSNGLFLKEILRYNDLRFPEELAPGTIVYLQAKKNHSSKGLDKYIVEVDGESLRAICQRFGVKMKSVEKMNGFERGHSLREGDEVLLRNEKKDLVKNILNI